MDEIAAFLGAQTRAELWWILAGLGGQLVFMARFLVQWIASERARRSVVPVAFWWLSIAGAAILLAYAVWRADPVFILGQSLGFFIYARNLWLIRAEQRRAIPLGDPGGAPPPEDPPPSR
ncbi:MAG: lipid-A-disaccharide synthase N-terminal domain-containing protein [Pseudomonadota bacterium]